MLCFQDFEHVTYVKTGLDNVFVLKKGTYPSLEDAGCDDDGSSKNRVVHSIVAQVQAVIDTLGVEIVEKDETAVEEDHDVKD